MPTNSEPQARVSKKSAWRFNRQMRVIGMAAVLLALATLFALADSELDALAYYTLAAFLAALMVYCWGSIEQLRAQVEKLQRRAAGGDQAPD